MSSVPLLELLLESEVLLELLSALELPEPELLELGLLELGLLELGLLELGASVPPQAVSMETAMTAANATAAIFLDNLILMFLLFLFEDLSRNEPLNVSIYAPSLVPANGLVKCFSIFCHFVQKAS